MVTRDYFRESWREPSPTHDRENVEGLGSRETSFFKEMGPTLFDFRDD